MHSLRKILLILHVAPVCVYNFVTKHFQFFFSLFSQTGYKSNKIIIQMKIQCETHQT